jgi:hypothetical protein
MATNLVSAVMQFLTPDMIAKIASVLGLDRNVAQKAIAGAIPALLASFADVASSPNGARQLTSTLTQQSGSLESLKNLIGGSGQNSLAETGSSMLSGLFGGGTLDTMAQTIGKFAGIGEGTSKSMLGMLGQRFPDEHREWWSRLRTVHIYAVGRLVWMLAAPLSDGVPADYRPVRILGGRYWRARYSASAASRPASSGTVDQPSPSTDSEAAQVAASAAAHGSA